MQITTSHVSQYHRESEKPVTAHNTSLRIGEKTSAPKRIDSNSPALPLPCPALPCLPSLAGPTVRLVLMT